MILAAAFRVRVSWLTILLIYGTLLGCGDSGPRVVPVAGTVTLDGEPVDGAGVLFSPRTQGPSASATTDQEGRFRLKTGDLDGAVVGQYGVIITKSESVGVVAEEGEVSGKLGPGWDLINYLPEVYGNPQESGLEATVTEENNDFAFELKSNAK